jgi:hypothetical protein
MAAVAVRHDVQERFYVIDNTKRTQLAARKSLRRLVDKPRDAGERASPADQEGQINPSESATAKKPEIAAASIKS